MLRVHPYTDSALGTRSDEQRSKEGVRVRFVGRLVNRARSASDGTIAAPIQHPRAGAWGSVQWFHAPVKRQLHRDGTCPFI